MAADLLGAMRVEIVGDNSKLDKSIKTSKENTEKFGKSTAKLGSTLGKLFTGIGFALVAKKLFDLGKQAENLFQIQESAEAKLDQTLKATGHAAGLTADELKVMASELQNVTKVGDEATIGAQALLLTFKSIGGDVFPRALESILDVSEAMGQDLKSSTIQIGKALNDPISGLAALSRVGIQFTDVQKDLIKGFQNSGDLASAQGVILEELESQFGGVARAAALTSEGIEQQLNNSIGDLQETIGGLISEGMSPWRQEITGTVNDINRLIKTQLLQTKITAGEATKVEELINAKQKLSEEERELERRKTTLAIRIENLNNVTDVELSRQRTSREALERRIAAEKEFIQETELKITSIGRGIGTLEEQIIAEKEAQQSVIDLATLEKEAAQDKIENIEAEAEAEAEALERTEEINDIRKELEEERIAAHEALLIEIGEANEEAAAAEIALAEEVAQRKTDLAFQYSESALDFLSALDSFASATSEAELERLRKSGASEEELDKKKKEIAIREAKRKKALGLIDVGIDTASAIIGMLANPGGIPGVALSIGAGITGGIQAAAILATPLPSFATGGIVPGTPSRIDNTIANVASGELIANQDQKDRMLMEFLNGGGGSNGGTTIINAMIDKKVLFKIILDGSKQGKAQFDARSIINS